MRKHLLQHLDDRLAARAARSSTWSASRPPVSRARIERENPARTDELVGSVDAADAGRRRRRRRRGPARRSARWAALDRGRAGRRAARRCRPDRRRARRARRADGARDRQGAAPTAAASCGFAVTVLRWAADRAERAARRPGRRRRARPAAAAAPAVRRGRRDHPVERAGHPRGAQGRPGAGRRQRGRREAVAARAVRGRAGRRAARRAACPTAPVQVVHGDAETATALVGHPGVDRVAFTGGEHAGPGDRRARRPAR